MTPAAGFDAMCEFYAGERAEGCNPYNGGDSLAVRWTTSDWYLFPRVERTDLRLFGVVLTREMVSAERDDIPLHLSVVLLFEPSREFVELSTGSLLCGSVEQLDEFRRVVFGSAVFKAVGDHRPSAVRMLIGWATEAEPLP